MSRIVKLPTEDYKVSRSDSLGQGKYGTVYTAKNTKTGETVAAKEIHIPVEDEKKEDARQKAKKEAEHMKTCSHSNILKIFEIFVTESSVWIFMEFCQEGDLQNFFQTNKVTEQDMLKFCLDMINGVAYLHSKSLIHRDIKPQNILISRGKDKIVVAKIADFGLSKAIAECTGIGFASVEMLFTTRNIGTVIYMAPELYDENTTCSEKVDIFALGLTYFAMVCFKKPESKFLLPFDPECGTEEVESLGEEIHNMQEYELPKEDIEQYIDKFIPPEEKNSAIKSEIRVLVKKMVQLNPITRPKATVIGEKLEYLLKKTSNPTSATNYESDSDDDHKNEEVQEESKGENAENRPAENTMQQVQKSLAENLVKKMSEVLKDVKDNNRRPMERIQSEEQFEVGDLVRFRRIGIDQIKEAQKNCGEWKSEIREYVKNHGKVISVEENHVKVMFTETITFNLNPKILRIICYARSGEFHRNAVVQIWPTITELRKLQRAKEFSSDMAALIGSRGIVHAVHNDGDVLVESVLGISGLNRNRFFYNPKALKIIDESSEELKINDIVLVKVNDDLQKKKQIKEKVFGRVGQVVAMEGRKYVIQKHGNTYLFQREDLIRLCGLQDTEVHWHIKCHHCGNDPLTGVRHKCKTCENYDLCSRCMKRIPSVHELGHKFREFHKSVYQESLREKTHITITQQDDELEKLRQKLGEFQKYLPQEKTVKVRLGDMVFINPSKDRVMKWQTEAGSNFLPPMEHSLGKPGIITKIMSTSRSLVKVLVDGDEWIFCGKCLTKLLNKADMENVKTQ